MLSRAGDGGYPFFVELKVKSASGPGVFLPPPPSPPPTPLPPLLHSMDATPLQGYMYLGKFANNHLVNNTPGWREALWE